MGDPVNHRLRRDRQRAVTLGRSPRDRTEGRGVCPRSPASAADEATVAIIVEGLPQLRFGAHHDRASPRARRSLRVQRSLDGVRGDPSIRAER